MMDHSLRTISYIADIGDLLVLMARRKQQISTPTTALQNNEADKLKRIAAPKMICHVFESDEAQFIAQSIGQAFQVAYMVSSTLSIRTSEQNSKFECIDEIVSQHPHRNFSKPTASKTRVSLKRWTIRKY